MVIRALLKEIAQEAHRLSGQPVDTVYFGGGTPSLLTTGNFPKGELNLLLEAIHQNFTISTGAEITLEANPDDINEEKLEGWRHAGINRLSIGVQSFREADLTWMNRAHNAAEAERSIRLAQQSGFQNLTIDLIYGTPGLSDEAWLRNIDQALQLQVPHLSCYALTVEPKTALHHLVQTHKMPDTDPEQQSRQFQLLIDQMAAAGYEHYEISNFARPGWRSRHNSAYWQGQHYLGLGPGAHSYNGISRRWNISNNSVYSRWLLQNEPGQPTDPPPQPLFEEEILTPQNRFNEYVMTALRTLEGIDLQHLRATYGEEQTQNLLRAATRHNTTEPRVSITADHLLLTNAGKHFADGIAADLFI